MLFRSDPAVELPLGRSQHGIAYGLELRPLVPLGEGGFVGQRIADEEEKPEGAEAETAGSDGDALSLAREAFGLAPERIAAAQRLAEMQIKTAMILGARSAEPDAAIVSTATAIDAAICS